ncbi:matrixin family metalloprotease [Halomicroarcula sp. GCM10025709]|uniref:matrixin family metalloprotease n=1 Tax=Haloarcula TaxID=2237 RepID=UPI0024C2B430|nr:matrixin family metalloprotease [Halomicroarcula sp. YJ-61-S]
MNSAVASAVLALVVLTAGCSGVGDLQQSGLVGDAEHPLAGETVTVVVDGTPRERAVTAAAAQYWNGAGQQYVEFNVTLDVVAGDGSERDPDVVVTYTESVTDCGDDEFSAGCAPRPNASTGLERPADIEVQRGLSNESTLLVAKHEFGHLLGLRHDDEPQSVMYHERDLWTRDRPNASERALPWDDPALTVAVRNGSLPAEDRVAYRQEVQYALAYFDEGADGAVPSNLSLQFVADPSAADIVVTPVTDSACRDTRGSCSTVQGTDPDEDGAIETYRRVEIETQGVDTDAVSWHVARQLAQAVGVAGDELPAALTTRDPEQRRGQWHG